MHLKWYLVCLNLISHHLLCWASRGGATNNLPHVLYMGVSHSHQCADRTLNPTQSINGWGTVDFLWVEREQFPLLSVQWLDLGSEALTCLCLELQPQSSMFMLPDPKWVVSIIGAGNNIARNHAHGIKFTETNNNNNYNIISIAHPSVIKKQPQRRFTGC